MKNILNKIGKVSSFASRYIGIIIIAFSCLAFFMAGMDLHGDKLYISIFRRHYVWNGSYDTDE